METIIVYWHLEAEDCHKWIYVVIKQTLYLMNVPTTIPYTIFFLKGVERLLQDCLHWLIPSIWLCIDLYTNTSSRIVIHIDTCYILQVCRVPTLDSCFVPGCISPVLFKHRWIPKALIIKGNWHPCSYHVVLQEAQWNKTPAPWWTRQLRNHIHEKLLQKTYLSQRFSVW